MIDRCKVCDALYWTATKGEPCPACGQTGKRKRFSVLKMVAVLVLWTTCAALGVEMSNIVDTIREASENAAIGGEND